MTHQTNNPGGGSSEPPHTDLFQRAAEGTATEADRARLAELLQNDEQALADFIRNMDLHAALHRETAEPTAAKPNLSAPRSRGGAGSDANVRIAPGSTGRPSNIAIPIALAAALLLAAAVVAIYVFATNRTSPIDDRTSSAPIATLIESTGTVIYEDGIANPGDEYAAGSYSIESGSAQFVLRGGTTVDLYGNTRLIVHSRSSATLSTGAATFHCPPEAKGYTVHLPDGSRVVDLGTRFAVEIDPDDPTLSHVRVTEGIVEVHPASDATVSEPVRLTRAMSTEVRRGRPAPPTMELLVNGDFDEGISGWNGDVRVGHLGGYDWTPDYFTGGYPTDDHFVTTFKGPLTQTPDGELARVFAGATYTLTALGFSADNWDDSVNAGITWSAEILVDGEPVARVVRESDERNGDAPIKAGTAGPYPLKVTYVAPVDNAGKTISVRINGVHPYDTSADAIKQEPHYYAMIDRVSLARSGALPLKDDRPREVKPPGADE